MPEKRVSQAEFARQNGWSKQYVAKLVKQGRIKLDGGKIDPVAARQAMSALAEPSTTLRQPPADSANQQPRSPIGGSLPSDNRKVVDYAAARTMREAYRAKMARLDYEEREGKLVDAKKMYEEGFQLGRQVRDALLGITDRLADILAAESDSANIGKLLRSELELVLQQICEE